MSSIIGTRIRGEERADRPRLPSSEPARPSFLYMSHPFAWYWHEGEGGGEWLPRLLRMVIQPGVNGVRRDGSTGPARTMAAERGATVIEYSDPRLGRWADYVQVFENTNGHKIHKSIFDSVRVIAGRVRWKHDREEYMAFLRHLLSSGVIDPIDPDVAHELAERERSTLARLEQREARNPADRNLAAQAEAQRQRLAAMLSAATPPKPKRRKRRAKAQAAPAGDFATVPAPPEPAADV